MDINTAFRALDMVDNGLKVANDPETKTWLEQLRITLIMWIESWLALLRPTCPIGEVWNPVTRRCEAPQQPPQEQITGLEQAPKIDYIELNPRPGEPFFGLIFRLRYWNSNQPPYGVLPLECNGKFQVTAPNYDGEIQAFAIAPPTSEIEILVPEEALPDNTMITLRIERIRDRISNEFITVEWYGAFTLRQLLSVPQRPARINPSIWEVKR